MLAKVLLTAAIPMENPYCSCKLTEHVLSKVLPELTKAGWSLAEPISRLWAGGRELAAVRKTRVGFRAVSLWLRRPQHGAFLRRGVSQVAAGCDPNSTAVVQEILSQVLLNPLGWGNTLQ